MGNFEQILLSKKSFHFEYRQISKNSLQNLDEID